MMIFVPNPKVKTEFRRACESVRIDYVELRMDIDAILRSGSVSALWAVEAPAIAGTRRDARFRRHCDQTAIMAREMFSLTRYMLGVLRAAGRDVVFREANIHSPTPSVDSDVRRFFQQAKLAATWLSEQIESIRAAILDGEDPEDIVPPPGGGGSGSAAAAGAAGVPATTPKIHTVQ